MNKDVRLGIEIQKLAENSYTFSQLIDFITGKSEDGYYFQYLKPLYDEFGYNEVNNILLELATPKEVKNDC